MKPDTHQAISHRLCGEPVELQGGFAAVRMTVGDEMRADAQGLAHGGFLFGLADHAAMLAVNEPTVVLGSASVRFLKPVVVGDELRAEGRVHHREGKKSIVLVDVRRGEEVVCRGEFVCFTPDRHVLEISGPQREEPR